MIISGLKETFIKRYIVERTKKAELRPEEQSEKPESCRENSVERAIKTEIDTVRQMKLHWVKSSPFCKSNSRVNSTGVLQTAGVKIVWPLSI